MSFENMLLLEKEAVLSVRRSRGNVLLWWPLSLLEMFFLWNASQRGPHKAKNHVEELEAWSSESCSKAVQHTVPFCNSLLGGRVGGAGMSCLHKKGQKLELHQMSKEEKWIFTENLMLFSAFQNQWSKITFSWITFVISVLKCIVASWLLSVWPQKTRKER